MKTLCALVLSSFFGSLKPAAIDNFAFGLSDLADSFASTQSQHVKHYVQNLTPLTFDVTDLKKLNDQKIDLAKPVDDIIPVIPILENALVTIKDTRLGVKEREQVKSALIDAIGNMSAEHINQDIKNGYDTTNILEQFMYKMHAGSTIIPSKIFGLSPEVKYEMPDKDILMAFVQQGGDLFKPVVAWKSQKFKMTSAPVFKIWSQEPAEFKEVLIEALKNYKKKHGHSVKKDYVVLLTEALEDNGQLVENAKQTLRDLLDGTSDIDVKKELAKYIN